MKTFYSVIVLYFTCAISFYLANAKNSSCGDGIIRGVNLGRYELICEYYDMII